MEAAANFIREFGSVWGMIFAWAFIIVYGRFFRWTSTPMGKALWWRSLALACVLTINVIGIWVPDFPGRIYISAGVYLFIAYTITWLLWVLVLQVRANVNEYYGVDKK